MNNQNWQLNEGDPFASAAPDTLEHLPSHHCAQPEIDPRFAAAHYGDDLKPSITDIKARLRIKTPNVWLMMRIAEDAAQHIAMLESEAEQLRMSVQDAEREIETQSRWKMDAQKKAAMYEHVRTLNPRDFADMWTENACGGKAFDDLVLADMDKRKKERPYIVSQNNAEGMLEGFGGRKTRPSDADLTLIDEAIAAVNRDGVAGDAS